MQQRPKQPTGKGPAEWFTGLVQSRGGQTVEIRPGDVIYTPNGEEHWHGATPEHFLTHLSITEGPAHWGAQVTDGEYQASRSR